MKNYLGLLASKQQRISKTKINEQDEKNFL